MWRCCNRRCSGGLRTIDNRLQKQYSHGDFCASNAAANKIAVSIEKCKNEAPSSFSPVPALVSDTLATLQNAGIDLVQSLLNVSSVTRTIYRVEKQSVEKIESKRSRKLAKPKNFKSLSIVQNR